VPTDTNWTTLSDHLGGFLVAGGEMKEIGTAHWMSPNTGATNSSGFTGLSDGFRFDYGFFFGMGSYANWWSSTEYTNTTTNTVNVWIRHLDHDNSAVTKSGALKKIGFSVRLVSDTLFSDSPTNIETIETQKINIYPNPNEGQFFVEIPKGCTELLITDIAGKVMKRIICADNTKVEVDITSFPSGVYFVRVLDKDKWLSGRVVKG
jgi:hypothetical protein